MPADWPLILCYHDLGEAASSRYVVRVGAFERQLRQLLEDGFEPLTLSDAIERGPFGEGNAPARSFTVTFDDAFASFRTLAAPVLERLGLLSVTTMFVPTAYVGGTASWNDDAALVRPTLTWEEIAGLADTGVGFGSHGHAHLPMQDLTYDEALSDVRASLGLLREHGIEARYFALPFGWRSEESKRAVRDAGLDAALSVVHGGRDRFEIRRVPVYGTDGGLTWRLKTSGRYFDVFEAAATLAGKRRGDD